MTSKRCPYCNCLLDYYSLIGQRKHIERCMRNKNRVLRTGRPVGHPRTRRRIGGPR